MQRDPVKEDEHATHRLKPSELLPHSEYDPVPTMARRHGLRELPSGRFFQIHSYLTFGCHMGLLAHA